MATKHDLPCHLPHPYCSGGQIHDLLDVTRTAGPSVAFVAWLDGRARPRKPACSALSQSKGLRAHDRHFFGVLLPALPKSSPSLHCHRLEVRLGTGLHQSMLALR